MQDKTVNLEVTINELNVIIFGISKLPIEVGLQTLNKIEQQAKQQLNLQNNVEVPLEEKTTS